MSQGEKPAYQQRSRKTREKIVAALDAALKERPFDQVSMADIAARAGVAVGTLYRRFENKDALIPVIMEIYQSHLDLWLAGESAIDVKPTDDLRSILRKIMRKAWTLCQREAHLLRAVHLYARLRPELAESEAWPRFEQAAADTIVQLLDHYSGSIKRPNTKRTRALATYFMNSIFIEKALYPDESPATLYAYSGRSLADDAADMLYAFLQLPEE